MKILILTNAKYSPFAHFMLMWVGDLKTNRCTKLCSYKSEFQKIFKTLEWNRIKNSLDNVIDSSDKWTEIKKIGFKLGVFFVMKLRGLLPRQQIKMLFFNFGCFFLSKKGAKTLNVENLRFYGFRRVVKMKT